MAEHPHPDDELRVEDFELEALDGAALASLFNEDAEVPAASTGQDDDGLVLDLEDEREPSAEGPVRGGPAFGPLADVDEGDAKPLLGDETVFDPHTGDDILSALPEDEQPAEPAPAPEPEPEQASEGKRKLSLRDRARIAKATARGEDPESALDEDERHALSAEADIPDVGLAAPKKSPRKEKAAAADTSMPDEPKRKLSIKDSLAQAKSEAKTPKRKKASAGEADAGPAPEKLSLKQRVAGKLAEAKESSTKGHASADQESLDAPQVFLDDGDGAAEATGMLGKVKAFWADRKQMAAAADAPTPGDPLAGVDASAPSVGEKLRDRVRPRESAEARSSRFAELLTRLDGAELERLQRDVQETQPVFVRVQKTRELAQTRQWVGFIVGFLTVLLFAVANGRDYLIETLPEAPQPSWVPAEAAGDPAGAAIFVLGLLLPLVGALIIADTVRYAWQGMAERRLGDLLLAILGVVCAVGVFKALGTAEVFAAVGFGITWMVGKAVIRGAFSLMRRLGSRS